MAEIAQTFIEPFSKEGYQHGGSLNSLRCDNINESVAWIFQQPIDDTITHIGVRINENGGTAANDSYTAVIETVSATTGAPTGTDAGGGSPTAVTFPNATYTEASLTAGVWQWFALTNSIALQAGTAYAVVIRKTNADDLVNYLGFTYGGSTYGFTGTQYTATADTTPTWTKRTNAVVMGMKSASRYYGMPLTAMGTSNTFGGTVERGFTFTIPSAWGTGTFGLRSVRINVGGTAFAAGGTMDMVLYQSPTSSPTILQRLSAYDTDILQANATATELRFLFPEDSLSALVPGTAYGIGFSHSAATSGSISSMTLADAASAAAVGMGGFTMINRTIAAYPPAGTDGNFTNTNTALIWARLGFQAYTPPTAGGGLRLAGIGGLAA